MDFTKEELETFMNYTRQSRSRCEWLSVTSLLSQEENDNYKTALEYWRKLERKLQHYLEEK